MTIEVKPLEFAVSARRACSRPEPSYTELGDSTDAHFVTQGPKIHPHILIEAIINYWLVHRCSKRELVVADRLPQDFQYPLFCRRRWIRDQQQDQDRPVNQRATQYRDNHPCKLFHCRTCSGLRASRCNYYDVLPSRYSSPREENLKRSDMIHDQKMSSWCLRKSLSTHCRYRTKTYVGNAEGPSQIATGPSQKTPPCLIIAARSVRWTLLGKVHPFDMRLSVRTKFSMEHKEAREVSASNAPVLLLRWYLNLVHNSSNINLHEALAPQQKNVDFTRIPECFSKRRIAPWKRVYANLAIFDRDNTGPQRYL
ncbi:hypothetical protein ARMGADRAFT_1037292 [Armillaria gallica]|uniref:Uncharacterized protein n=1 Tax=Armillaria gallica TaxID=47427 RepID=A0A2H3CMA4_ARMGA|nr:hypothetical protein ARMGADRAFT_1037292 [Armillaria gallica]